MKKTYWWRIAVSSISGTGIIIGYLLFYPKKFGICDFITNYCMLNNYRENVARPLFYFAIFIFLISFVYFFANDLVFKKWLKFAIAWFVLASVFIYLAPTYSTQVVGNPTKESISIWMGSLFVIISLVQIILEHKKSKRK